MECEINEMKYTILLTMWVGT